MEMNFTNTIIAQVVATVIGALIIHVVKSKIENITSWIGTAKITAQKINQKDARPFFGFLALCSILYLLIDTINSSEPLTRGAAFEIALFTFALGVLILHKPK
jgi:uncharacterized membrane protein